MEPWKQRFVTSVLDHFPILMLYSVHRHEELKKQLTKRSCYWGNSNQHEQKLAAQWASSLMVRSVLVYHQETSTKKFLANSHTFRNRAINWINHRKIKDSSRPFHHLRWWELNNQNLHLDTVVPESCLHICTYSGMLAVNSFINFNFLSFIYIDQLWLYVQDACIVCFLKKNHQTSMFSYFILLKLALC